MIIRKITAPAGSSISVATDDAAPLRYPRQMVEGAIYRCAAASQGRAHRRIRE